MVERDDTKLGGFMKKLICIVAMFVMVMFGSPAMALDTGACSYFPHNNWGSNVSCLGKMELSDMGTFTDGSWTWKPEFQTLFDEAPYPVPVPSIDELIPSSNTEIIINYGRFDNKRYANQEPNSRISGLNGSTGGTLRPSVWKMHVEDPNNFTEAVWLHPNPNQDYPVDIIHADYILSSSCQALCDDNGCPFDSGPVTASDGTVCDWNFPQTGLYGGILWDIEDSELNLSNVAYVELNDQQATPLTMENNELIPMSWNTGDNSLHGGATITERNLCFNHFTGLLPVGDYVAVLYMNDGRTKDLPFTVASDRVMPTIAATTEVFTPDVIVEKVNKKGKIIKASFGEGGTEIVPNMNARELDGQLIIQFAEPDGAFQAPLPNTSGIRLKIMIGSWWKSTPPEDALTMLWIDVPVHSGTVVVPVAQWESIKQKMRDIDRDFVEIAGMYREQFNGYPLNYHNRGYIEMTTYTFE